MTAIFSQPIDSKSRRKLQNFVDAKHLHHPLVIKQNEDGYTLSGRLGTVVYQGKFLGENFRAAKNELEKVLP